MLRFTFASDQGDPGTSGFVTDANSRLQEAVGAETLRQSIRLLLSIRPGERLAWPEYGCALDKLVFEPNDATTAGVAIRLVTDAVTRFEPRALLQAVDAYPDPDDAALIVIDIAYSDRRSGAADRMQLPVSLESLA